MWVQISIVIVANCELKEKNIENILQQNRKPPPPWSSDVYDVIVDIPSIFYVFTWRLSLNDFLLFFMCVCVSVGSCKTWETRAPTTHSKRYR